MRAASGRFPSDMDDDSFPPRGLVDTLIGGWNMTGIVTYQSGQSVTIGCTTSTTSSGGCYALPNKGIQYNNAKTLTHWLNAAAYSNPALATAVGQTDFAPFGSEPAQAFGPSFHRGDLGVEKLFHLPGENVFEFRAEAFNITNHPNFGQPGTLTPNNAAFASITSTRDAPSDARELQFALKFFFGNGGQYYILEAEIRGILRFSRASGSVRDGISRFYP